MGVAVGRPRSGGGSSRALSSHRGSVSGSPAGRPRPSPFRPARPADTASPAGTPHPAATPDPAATPQPGGLPGTGYTPPPKPGLIPLHPLSFGELLGASFAVLRYNPRATVVPTLLINVIQVVVSLGLFGLIGFSAYDRIAHASDANRGAIIAGSIAEGGPRRPGDRRDLRVRHRAPAGDARAAWSRAAPSASGRAPARRCAAALEVLLAARRVRCCSSPPSRSSRSSCSCCSSSASPAPEPSAWCSRS